MCTSICYFTTIVSNDFVVLQELRFSMSGIKHLPFAVAPAYIASMVNQLKKNNKWIKMFFCLLLVQEVCVCGCGFGMNSWIGVSFVDGLHRSGCWSIAYKFMSVSISHFYSWNKVMCFLPGLWKGACLLTSSHHAVGLFWGPSSATKNKRLPGFCFVCACKCMCFCVCFACIGRNVKYNSVVSNLLHNSDRSQSNEKLEVLDTLF